MYQTRPVLYFTDSQGGISAYLVSEFAHSSEHVTLASLPESTEGTAYARIGSIGWQYYGGPQGINRDDLSARVGVEGLADYHPVEA